MVLYPFLLSQSWSTTVPNFMLVSGIAQSGQNLALSRLAIRANSLLQFIHHVTIEIQVAKVLGEERLSNLEFRYHIIV